MTSARRWVAAALVGTCVSASTVIGAAPALADDAAFDVAGVTATDASKALTGIAADPERSWFWVVTDATANQVTAVDGTGAKQATVSWASVKVTDVQALAWRDSVLYVGDIGDRAGNRASIQVLRIAEPRDGQRNPQVFTFTYPDGAHDAAALTVSPRGNLYLVTRGENPGIYRPVSQPVNGATVALTRVADAPADVSDVVFTPDGQQLAMRSPLGVTLVNAFTFATTARGPIEGWPAGEALTNGINGAPLMVGELGSGGARVAPMALPQGISTATPPAPTPTPTPTPSPSAGGSSGSSASGGASAAPTAAATTAPSVWESQTSGTLLAVGIAFVVAVIAGALTLISRRR
ncbi:hypothetical protein ACSDQ9_09580 [Aestuariimicrobium soli]|uniref:hypothetical protein n=1 Tax=Aestuariimicrobium soli TaxID=2035834 RepID=UPI003EBB1B63